MIEDEDLPTTPRAVLRPLDDHATTIQVPLPTEETTPTTVAPQAPAVPSLPYLTVEDLLSLQIANDPQVSPDGALIAFTVLQCHAESNTTSSAIWFVSRTGGKTQPPWQVSSGTHHDTQPRWSPDGRSLAFLSDRNGSSQLYLLPLTGGEARQISFLAQGVTTYSWRPNGTMLLAHSLWKPGDEQTDNNTIPESDVDIITRLDNSKDGIGYKQGRHQQLWLLPLDGTAIRLTSEPVDLLESCWSPDGQEIAFCANRRPDPDLSTSRALWVLTLASGQLRRLTAEEGLARVPSWSPDGLTIAYLYTDELSESGNISPWLVSADGSAAPHPAVSGADALTCQTWIIDELRSEYLQAPQWYPNSQSLFVTAQERGQVHLCQLDLIKNSTTRLTSGNGRYLTPSLSSDGQVIALLRADWFTPGDVWCMDGEGKNLRKLSRVNDVFLQRHQLLRPQRITWHGTDGLEIEGFLYLPPLAENQKAPLIVMPHGGPTLSWGDSYVHEFQVLAGRGYAVLAPNLRGSAGYGEEFSRKAFNDWGGADFHDLMAGIDHVIAVAPIDEQRLGISGISYGGYMTNLALTQTNRFKAAVSRNSMSSLPNCSLLSSQAIWFNLSIPDPTEQYERSALTHVDNITTPLLLLHAEQDFSCPFSEAQQLFVALRMRKRTVELVRYRNASHLMDWPDVGTPQQRVDRLHRTLTWFEHFV